MGHRLVTKRDINGENMVLYVDFPVRRFPEIQNQLSELFNGKFAEFVSGKYLYNFDFNKQAFLDQLKSGDIETNVDVINALFEGINSSVLDYIIYNCSIEFGEDEFGETIFDEKDNGIYTFDDLIVSDVQFTNKGDDFRSNLMVAGEFCNLIVDYISTQKMRPDDEFIIMFMTNLRDILNYTEEGLCMNQNAVTILSFIYTFRGVLVNMLSNEIIFNQTFKAIFGMSLYDKYESFDEYAKKFRQISKRV